MTNPNFHSTSRVILMCGPAGSGKSTVAQQLEGQRLVRLSFDEESFQRGIVEHPLAQAIHAETVEWLDDAFLVIRFTLDGEAHFVIRRSDANDAYRVLYYDDRGVCRVFAMTFADGHWTLSRADPDFHQRFIADVEPDRIAGRWEASEDEGRTWRKDFDLLFERI